jgi:hypothetical protein
MKVLTYLTKNGSYTVPTYLIASCNESTKGRWTSKALYCSLEKRTLPGNAWEVDNSTMGNGSVYIDEHSIPSNVDADHCKVDWPGSKFLQSYHWPGFWPGFLPAFVGG